MNSKDNPDFVCGDKRLYHSESNLNHHFSERLDHQCFDENELLPSSEIITSVLNSDPVKSSSCKMCCDNGLIFSDLNGFVDIQFCTCLARESESWEKNKFDQLKIPSGYLEASGNNVLGIPREITTWISQGFNESLLLTGLPGRGKTFIGFYILFSFLKKSEKIPKNPCFYAQCSDIDEAFVYNQKTKFDSTKKNFRLERLISQCLETELLILDEVGRKKGEPDYLFNIVDQRIGRGKPTIFLSNHAFEAKRSLNKKTLLDLTGERISSRLSTSTHIHLSGIDRRKIIETVSEEEAMNWKFPERILYEVSSENPVENYRNHLLDWMARHPVFEPIDAKKRKKYTAKGFDQAGNEIEYDVPRKEVKTVDCPWHKDGLMMIQGPYCGYDDAVLYQSLLNMLAEQHVAGNKGIILKTSLYMILKNLGLSDKYHNYRSLERKIHRLININITYYRGGRLCWSNGLLSSFNTQAREIAFNKCMIPFYNAGDTYSFQKSFQGKKKSKETVENGEKTKSLSGYAALLYYFLASHKNLEFARRERIDFWKALFSMPEEMSTKASTDRLRKSFRAVQSITGIIDNVKITSSKVYYEASSTFHD